MGLVVAPATFGAIGTGTASLEFANALPQLLVNDLAEEYVGTTLLGATLSTSSPPVSVPEPSSLSTLLIGLPALLASRKRRRREQPAEPS